VRLAWLHLGVREEDMGEANEGAAELARCVDKTEDIISFFCSLTFFLSLASKNFF